MITVKISRFQVNRPKIFETPSGAQDYALRFMPDIARPEIVRVHVIELGHKGYGILMLPTLSADKKVLFVG